MAGAYYNENDPKAAAWLRELIKEGLIAPGIVDERSITEIQPHDLTGYTQQHFFAGIGGWSYALRLAGWPDKRPVRTGSCPCQPFSQAGAGRGTADPRHLWPVFRDLITFGEPTVTFGEQVASAAGREWLAGVRSDLEGLGYEVGAADLCAAGAGSPHIRQRLYWVGDSQRVRYSTPRVNRTLDSAIFPQQGEKIGAAGRRILGFWQEYRQNNCRDRRTRRTPVEPAFYPLAHGISGRVAQLRGLGNAIVPQVAAQFIEAYLEVK